MLLEMDVLRFQVCRWAWRYVVFGFVLQKE
jgi:hypothetical protein